MLEVGGAVVLVGVACALALRPALLNSLWGYLFLGVPYAAMTVVYVIRSVRNGTAVKTFRPRSGDLSLGFVLAVLLFLGVLIGRSVLTPTGSMREGWLMLLYMRIGEPSWVQKNLMLVSLLTVLVAVLEEIAWRGYVMSAIRQRLGQRAAWPATAVLNAVAYVPTMVLVRDPSAGLNPLVVLAALGSGLVWGFVASRTERLSVVVLSHALFAWAVFVQFPIWRLGYAF